MEVAAAFAAVTGLAAVSLWVDPKTNVAAITPGTRIWKARIVLSPSSASLLSLTHCVRLVLWNETTLPRPRVSVRLTGRVNAIGGELEDLRLVQFVSFGYITRSTQFDTTPLTVRDCENVNKKGLVSCRGCSFVANYPFVPCFRFGWGPRIPRQGYSGGFAVVSGLSLNCL